MKVIGITGGVGSGKSALLKYIAKNYNCRVILADEVAHQAKEPGQPCYEELIKLLSSDILNEDGIAISRLTLSQCKLDSISSLDFSYDKIERQSDDFTIDIVFNNIDYEFL